MTTNIPIFSPATIPVRYPAERGNTFAPLMDEGDEASVLEALSRHLETESPSLEDLHSLLDKSLEKNYFRVFSFVLDLMPVQEAVQAINQRPTLFFLISAPSLPLKLCKQLDRLGWAPENFNKPDESHVTLLQKLARTGQGDAPFFRSVTERIGGHNIRFSSSFDKAELDRCLNLDGKKRLIAMKQDLASATISQHGCTTTVYEEDSVTPLHGVALRQTLRHFRKEKEDDYDPSLVHKPSQAQPQKEAPGDSTPEFDLSTFSTSNAPADKNLVRSRTQLEQRADRSTTVKVSDLSSTTFDSVGEEPVQLRNVTSQSSERRTTVKAPDFSSTTFSSTREEPVQFRNVSSQSSNHRTTAEAPDFSSTTFDSAREEPIQFRDVSLQSSERRTTAEAPAFSSTTFDSAEEEPVPFRDVSLQSSEHSTTVKAPDLSSTTFRSAREEPFQFHNVTSQSSERRTTVKAPDFSSTTFGSARKEPGQLRDVMLQSSGRGTTAEAPNLSSTTFRSAREEPGQLRDVMLQSSDRRTTAEAPAFSSTTFDSVGEEPVQLRNVTSQSSERRTTVKAPDFSSTTFGSARKEPGQLRDVMLQSSDRRTTAEAPDFSSTTFDSVEEEPVPLRDGMLQSPERRTRAEAPYHSSTSFDPDSSENSSLTNSERNGTDTSLAIRRRYTRADRTRGSSARSEETAWFRVYLDRGHAMLSVQNPETREYTHLGFYPVNREQPLSRLIRGVPCEIRDDSVWVESARQENRDIAIQTLITADQADNILDHIELVQEQCKQGRRQFRLIGDNCVDFINEIYQAAGLRGPQHLGHELTPVDFSRHFHSPFTTSPIAMQYAMLQSHGLLPTAAANLMPTQALVHFNRPLQAVGQYSHSLIFGAATLFLTYRGVKAVWHSFSSCFSSYPAGATNALYQRMDELNRDRGRFEASMQEILAKAEAVCDGPQQDLSPEQVQHISIAYENLRKYWNDLSVDIEFLSLPRAARISKAEGREWVRQTDELSGKFDTFTKMIEALKQLLPAQVVPLNQGPPDRRIERQIRSIHQYDARAEPALA